MQFPVGFQENCCPGSQMMAMWNMDSRFRITFIQGPYLLAAKRMIKLLRIALYTLSSIHYFCFLV